MRALIVFFGAIAALVLGLALAILLWAFSALKSDLSPPDPSTVPPVVLSLLRLDVGSKASLHASKLLIDYTPTRDLRHGPAVLLAKVWIDYRWTEEEALAEIALRSYFGQGFYGVHEAAHGYFGVPAEALTLPQAAALVASTWAPSRNPWCRPDKLETRVSELLAAFPISDDDSSFDGLLPAPVGACP